MTRPARAALAHPVWWISLAVLVANDHFLKGAGVVPAAITGKLSDVAGLVVAPVVLAALLRARTRHAALACVALTGAAFTAIKLSPAAARAAEHAMSWAGWRVWSDPTDLIALPALAIAWWILVRVAGDRAKPVRVRDRAVVGKAGLVVGAVACMATSSEGPPDDPRISDSVQIVNATGEPQTIHTRRLRPEVSVDCNRLVQKPLATAGLELYDASSEPWMLPPDESTWLETTGACDAAVLEQDGAGTATVVWHAGEPTPTVRLTKNGDGSYAWLASPTSFGFAFSLGEPAAPAGADACAADVTVGALVAIEPLAGELTWQGATEDAGCATISLAADDTGETVAWSICGVPLALLPFGAGDRVVIDANAAAEGRFTLFSADGSRRAVLLASVPPELHAVPDLNRCIAIGSCAERFEPFVVERDLDSGWALVSAPSETQHAFARRTADGVDQSLYVLYALDWIAVDDACPTGGGLIGPDVASLLVERR